MFWLCVLSLPLVKGFLSVPLFYNDHFELLSIPLLQQSKFLTLDLAITKRNLGLGIDLDLGLASLGISTEPIFDEEWQVQTIPAGNQGSTNAWSSFVQIGSPSQTFNLVLDSGCEGLNPVIDSHRISRRMQRQIWQFTIRPVDRVKEMEGKSTVRSGQ